MPDDDEPRVIVEELVFVFDASRVKYPEEPAL
jgi:hypothetical protein